MEQGSGLEPPPWWTDGSIIHADLLNRQVVATQGSLEILGAALGVGAAGARVVHRTGTGRPLVKIHSLSLHRNAIRCELQVLDDFVAVASDGSWLQFWGMDAVERGLPPTRASVTADWVIRREAVHVYVALARNTALDTICDIHLEGGKTGSVMLPGYEPTIIESGDVNAAVLAKCPMVVARLRVEGNRVEEARDFLPLVHNLAQLGPHLHETAEAIRGRSLDLKAELERALAGMESFLAAQTLDVRVLRRYTWYSMLLYHLNEHGRVYESLETVSSGEVAVAADSLARHVSQYVTLDFNISGSTSVPPQAGETLEAASTLSQCARPEALLAMDPILRCLRDTMDAFVGFLRRGI